MRKINTSTNWRLCQSHSPMAATLHRVRSLANRDGLGSCTIHFFVSQRHPFPEHHNILLLSGESAAEMNLIQNSQCSAGCPHLFWIGLQRDFPDFCFLLCPSALNRNAKLLSVPSCPLLALIPLSRLHFATMVVCMFEIPLPSLQFKKPPYNWHHLSHSDWLLVTASEYENMVIV